MAYPNIGCHTWGFFQDDNSDINSQSQIGSTDSTSEVFGLDTNIQIRIGTWNDTSANFNSQVKLQYQVDSGGWNDVTGSSSYVRSSAGNGTEGTSTCSTQKLTSHPTFSWDNTGQFDETDGAVTSAPHGKSTFWEDQWCVQFRSADLTGGEVIEFRTRDIDVNTTYTDPGTFPKITISSASNYTITGNIAVPISIASTMDYTLNASIFGSVSIPITIAAATSIGYTITGSVSVPITIASTMEAASNRSISGVVTIPIDIAATMVYTGAAINPIVLFDSVWISSGGAPTTPQLTPPNLLDNTDFTAGRIQDDENPADSIDVNYDGWTSLEWAVAPTVSSGTYKFRFTRSGTPLTSFVIPKLTISPPSGVEYSITGSVAVSITVAATLSVGYTITGSVTVPITVASIMAASYHESISGSVTIPITVASTMAASYHESILGSVTVPITIASTLQTNYHESITGSITVPITINANMLSSLGYAIFGNVTVPITVASTMDYTLNASITSDITVLIIITSAMSAGFQYTIAGSITVPITVAASTAVGYVFTGSVTVPITIASTMASSFGYAITGAVTIPITVASTLTAAYNESIVGSVSVPITIAATMQASQHPSIVGSITVPITISSTMSQGVTNTIIGDVTIPITIGATLAATIHRSITGAINIPITVSAGLDAQAHPSIVGTPVVVITPSSTMHATQHFTITSAITVSLGINSTMLYVDADTLFTSQVFTDLIGTGPISTGNILLRPLRPWVVWNGVVTRPAPVRLRIKNGQAYELDGVTPASVPPSYIASGVTNPLVIYPENNYYRVEVIMRGRTYERGYLKVPYNPSSSGVNWYNYTSNYEKQTYLSSGRYALDAVKVYTNTTTRDADINNVLEGTIVYTTADGNYWGRGKSGYFALDYP